MGRGGRSEGTAAQKSTWGRVCVGDWFCFPNKAAPLFRVFRVERNGKGSELHVVLRRQDGTNSDISFMVGTDEPINPEVVVGVGGRNLAPRKAQFVRLDGVVLNAFVED